MFKMRTIDPRLQNASMNQNPSLKRFRVYLQIELKS